MSISRVASGTIAYGTSSATPAYPAGLAAGDLLILKTGSKNLDGNSRVANPNWNVLGESWDNTGTAGDNTGPTRVKVMFKIADGTESGTLSVNNYNGNSFWAQIDAYRATSGKIFADVVKGASTPTSTTFAATCTPLSASPGIAAGWIKTGDVVIAIAAATNDAVTWSAQTIASTGLTFGSVTEIAEYTTVNGNDIGGCSWMATVTGGTQTNVNVTIGATQSVTSYGAALVVRLSENEPQPANVGVPAIVSKMYGFSDGTTNISLRKPPCAQDGDLVMLQFGRGSTTAGITDYLAKGWVRIQDSIINSRYFSGFARIYSDADGDTPYTLTGGANATFMYAMIVIRNHGVVNISADIARNTEVTRPASSAVTTLPGMTTTLANSLAIAFFGEGSNALGTWTQTTGDFKLAAEHPEFGVASSTIEYITYLYKEMPSIGATGNVVLDYSPAAAANGAARMFIIPPGSGPTPITTGQVKRYAVRARQTTLTVGAKKLGGTAVVAVLYNGAGTTELARATMSFDGTTSWGSHRFTGLTAGVQYLIKFEVDSVEQTDTDAYPKTLLASGTATSFKFGNGSCQFTGSNFRIWDTIATEEFQFLDSGGDIHYADATTEAAWRAGVDLSFNAAKFNTMLRTVPWFHSIDNHDRIMTNPGGAGTALNLGETDPATAVGLKHLYGSTDWAHSTVLGQTWQIGRVQFIHLDMWSVRDDADFDAEPRTFLGATQKQWFKDTLEASTAAVIIWFSQWTNRNNANGRWNSYPTETTELEAWLTARPEIKRRLVMTGGDSHSLQAGNGDYSGTTGYRFLGVPNLNVSGFNRSGDDGDGSTAWNIANASIKMVPGVTSENDVGAYSRWTVTDDGTHLRLKWEAVRVQTSGAVDVLAYWNRSYGQPWDNLYVGATIADKAYAGSQQIWEKEVMGV
jgi:hypothetical protein